MDGEKDVPKISNINMKIAHFVSLENEKCCITKCSDYSYLLTSHVLHSVYGSVKNLISATFYTGNLLRNCFKQYRGKFELHLNLL